MLRIFQQAFHVPGTLAADLNIRSTAPTDATILHISAVGSNAAAAGLNVGTSADTSAYLAKASIGVSNTPVEFERADFVGGEFPRVNDGDIIVAQLDFNYNGGGGASASANVTIVITFAEG